MEGVYQVLHLFLLDNTLPRLMVYQEIALTIFKTNGAD